MQGAEKPIRILLVDESEDFLSGVRSWLAGRRNLEIVGQIHSGEEAMEAIESLHPDLVLMDAVMPGMSGFETTGRIKKLPDAPRVIILTFHDSQAARLEAWAAGADQFVAKADLAEDLLPAIRGLFPTEKELETIKGSKGFLTPNSGNP